MSELSSFLRLSNITLLLQFGFGMPPKDLIFIWTVVWGMKLKTFWLLRAGPWRAYWDSILFLFISFVHNCRRMVLPCTTVTKATLPQAQKWWNQVVKDWKLKNPLSSYELVKFGIWHSNRKADKHLYVARTVYLLTVSIHRLHILPLSLSLPCLVQSGIFSSQCHHSWALIQVLEYKVYLNTPGPVLTLVTKAIFFSMELQLLDQTWRPPSVSRMVVVSPVTERSRFLYILWLTFLMVSHIQHLFIVYWSTLV